MKLLKNSSTFQIMDTDLLIGGNVYTRDFKEKPLFQSAQVTDPKVLFHYKNPVLLNPVITSYSSLGTTRWKIYTGNIHNGEKYIFTDSIGKSVDSTYFYSAIYPKKYSEDYETLTTRTICPIYGRPFEMGNFEYGFGYTTSASSNYIKYMGVSINLLDNFTVSKSPFTIYTQTSNSFTNNSTIRVLNTNSTSDLVAFDFVLHGTTGSFGASLGNFTGVSVSDFLNGTGNKANDLKLFNFNTNYTIEKYSKIIANGNEDWNTTVINNSSTYSTEAGRLDTLPSNMIQNQDGTYTMYCYRWDKVNYKDDTTGANFYKIIVDTNNKTYTVYNIFPEDSEYHLPYQWNPISKYSDLKMDGRGYKLEYRRVNSKNILTLIINNVTQDELGGIYSYEIDEANNTFTFCGKETPYNNTLINYYMINDTTMVTTSNLGYELFVLDTTTNKWVKTCSKQLDLWALVYDDISNALWYVDNSNNVYMDKLNLAMSADWGWENNALEWTGSEVKTNIYISCKNYKSEYISTEVVLTLTGNAIFSNNEKEIIINTSDEGSINVPVTIIGDGNITCSAKSKVA